MRPNKSDKTWAERSPKNQRNYFGRHLTSKSQQAQIESVQKRKKQKTSVTSLVTTRFLIIMHFHVVDFATSRQRKDLSVIQLGKQTKEKEIMMIYLYLTV